MTPTILMYVKHGCPYCERAKQLLTEKEVTFQEIFIDDHPERRAEMEKRSGRHTVPQIFIGTHHVGGCDNLYELEAEDKLDNLLSPDINSL